MKPYDATSYSIDPLETQEPSQMLIPPVMFRGNASSKALNRGVYSSWDHDKYSDMSLSGGVSYGRNSIGISGMSIYNSLDLMRLLNAPDVELNEFDMDVELKDPFSQPFGSFDGVRL